MLQNEATIDNGDLDRDLFISDLREALDGALETINQREAETLDLRYGLSDGYERTFQEIANIFGVTPTRAREITLKTLKKLRYPARNKQLRDFI